MEQEELEALLRNRHHAEIQEGVIDQIVPGGNGLGLLRPAEAPGELLAGPEEALQQEDAGLLGKRGQFRGDDAPKEKAQEQGDRLLFQPVRPIDLDQEKDSRDHGCQDQKQIQKALPSFRVSLVL